MKNAFSFSTSEPIPADFHPPIPIRATDHRSNFHDIAEITGLLDNFNIMYKNIPFYEPFQHENLEVKNNIIISARGQDRKKIEGAFTAILIYANLVDYLVSTLLDNLQRMITIDSFNRFGGIFYFDGSVKKTNRPLGFLIRELEPLEFPGKKDFMDCLVRFNKLRNPIMHELMKRDPNDAAKNLDREVDNFVNTAEDILARFNTITAGILVAWRKNYPAPATSSSQQTPNAKG